MKVTKIICDKCGRDITCMDSFGAVFFRKDADMVLQEENALHLQGESLGEMHEGTDLSMDICTECLQMIMRKLEASWNEEELSELMQEEPMAEAFSVIPPLGTVAEVEDETEPEPEPEKKPQKKCKRHVSTWKDPEQKPPKKKKMTQKEAEEVAERYRAGESMEDIGEVMNIEVAPISRFISAAGLAAERYGSKVDGRTREGKTQKDEAVCPMD